MVLVRQRHAPRGPYSLRLFACPRLLKVWAPATHAGARESRQGNDAGRILSTPVRFAPYFAQVSGDSYTLQIAALQKPPQSWQSAPDGQITTSQSDHSDREGSHSSMPSRPTSTPHGTCYTQSPKHRHLPPLRLRSPVCAFSPRLSSSSPARVAALNAYRTWFAPHTTTNN